MDWATLYETIWKGLPPFFVGTLLSAAFGAFAGAWINSRIQTKKTVVTELNNVSAAIMLCLSICNRSMALKRQYIRPMYEGYRRALQEHEAFLEKKRRGEATAFHLRAELQTVPRLKMPTELLERCVFEKISIRGRALAAAVELVGAIDSLDQAIQYRNDFISETQKASPVPSKILTEKYLGLKTADGVTDVRFGENMTGLFVLTNDCIFFSKLLADDLLRFGANLRRRHARKLNFGLPKFEKADWSKVERSGLLPQTSNYHRWLQGFKRRPTRWQRLKLRWQIDFGRIRKRWLAPK